MNTRFLRAPVDIRGLLERRRDALAEHLARCSRCSSAKRLGDGCLVGLGLLLGGRA